MADRWKRGITAYVRFTLSPVPSVLYSSSILPSWDSSVERRTVAQSRRKQTQGKKRVAGNAQQVCRRCGSLSSPLSDTKHRHRVQAAAAQGMAAHSHPKDRSSNSFYYWHYFCTNWRLAYLGVVSCYRDDFRLHRLRKAYSFNCERQPQLRRPAIEQVSVSAECKRPEKCHP
jgi:hypothetical protein